MLELSERIASDDFAQIARHPDFPNAFTRSRKLPLPALIGALLTMRSQSQQAMLDGFFASVCGTECPQRGVSDRAFAKARERLHMPALASLNDLVVRRADEAGWVERWCGLRVVAADASVLMPAVRACLLDRSSASPDQRLFALYLPGAELTLHASVHSPKVAERNMLMEALDVLGPDDVLVLDRGCPAAWLVALLNARGIRFVMRCDNDSGWSATKAFKRLKLRMKLEAVSGLSQQALIIDVAAKVLADNITSLMCSAAADQSSLATRSRKCNRSYAAMFMQPVLPRLVLFIADVYTSIAEAIDMLGTNTQRFKPGRSQPRPSRHVKPHPSCSCKA